MDIGRVEGPPKTEQGTAVREKLEYVRNLIGSEWKNARANRSKLEQVLLDLSGFSSKEEFIKAVRAKTAVVYFMAGSGSRWVKSFATEEGKVIADTYHIDPALPRAMAPVNNLYPEETDSRKFVPIGTYNLRPAKDYGSIVVVYSGGADVRRNIAKDLTLPLHIDPEFVEQPQPLGGGKPRGHGDALIDVLNSGALVGKEYVVTVMSSDVTDPRTIYDSLLLMHVADKYVLDVSAVLPATPESDKYPFALSQGGMPIGFYDSRHLGGDQPRDLPSNVGITVYKKASLVRELHAIESAYKRDYKSFNKAGELGIQDVNQKFMDQRRAVIMAIASGIETENAKSVTGIPRFLKHVSRSLTHQGIRPRRTVAIIK